MGDLLNLVGFGLYLFLLHMFQMIVSRKKSKDSLLGSISRHSATV
jgi:hypothetical protein